MGHHLSRNEEVYRAVKRSKPSCVDEKHQRVTSALFKDAEGVSVDRQGRRTREVSLSAMENFFAQRLKGVAMIHGVTVMDAGAIAIAAPSTEDPYHMELYADEMRKPVTQLQALQLADAAELVFWKEEVAWTGGRSMGK